MKNEPILIVLFGTPHVRKLDVEKYELAHLAYEHYTSANSEFCDIQH